MRGGVEMIKKLGWKGEKREKLGLTQRGRSEKKMEEVGGKKETGVID